MVSTHKGQLEGKKYPKILYLLLFVLSISIQLNAQNSVFSLINSAFFNAEKLSEVQLKQLAEEIQHAGKTWEQVKQEMLKNNIPNAEIEKLYQRLQKNTNMFQEKQSSINSSARTYVQDNSEPIENRSNQIQSRIFGANLFRNKQYNFQPNLKIATPLNYILGPDDEIVIDLSGFSDATYTVKISPEGIARIPLFGAVYVSGLTIEQASKKIKSHIGKYNPSVQNGQTTMSLSLGAIRTIKVILLGEVMNPGTYSLPSLATVFNALYAAGGPNDVGSFRLIKLIRNNRQIAVMDVYEFLMTGATKGNMRLEDQDIVKVEPYISRIQFNGQMKHPGIFELKSNESLKELIQFAGGFTPNAYSQQIQVIRNDGNQQVVATVKLDDIQNFKPQNGDIFEVQSILDRFKNRIQISGAVFRPGYFALETSANIKDLLNNAGGLKEDAFKSRAILYRLNADNSQEVLSLNLDEILNGNAPNISLKREDQLVVASKLNMKIQESIAVTGEVLFPGTFSFGSEMVLEDALVLAGGLKIGADVKKIQVSRRSKEANKTQKNGNLSESYTIEVNNNLADLKKFKLEPDDQIHVFRAASFQSLKSISVQGEVLFPGTYPILRNNESISDIMKRTGGLTANAFPEGAVLIRNNEVNEYTEIKDKRANLSLLNINRKNKADSMFFELNNLKNKALIGLNLNKIIKGQKSADLNVSENDIIYIPHYNPLVSISGQVLYPNQSKYSSKKSFKNYISEAGGFTSSSLKRKSFVVYQNGSAKSTKNFLFFKFYPKIQPGAEIIVPTKAERKSVSNVELITITSTLTTLGFLISSLLK